ncbi:MAG: hypothetical protein J6T44_01485 [Prevotella sp.]|nr:hypothetical protein [Prevotella sp.]
MYRLLLFIYRVKEIILCLIQIIELENIEEVRRKGIKTYYSLFYIKKIIISPMQLYLALTGKVLNVRYIEIPLTTVCTLKCKGCSALIDSYPAALLRHIDINEIVLMLNSLTSAVDSIYKIRLLGGEPLCYPHLYDVLCIINNEDKIMISDIVTNGTLIIKDERILDILKNKKFHITISDYGPISRKKDELINQLRQNNIRYQIAPIEVWYDFGDLVIRDYSKAELREMFYNCRSKSTGSCKNLLYGRIFHCPRNSHGANIGKIPLRDSDYVDLLDNTVSSEEIKKRLFKFFYGYIPYVEACKYCSHGRYSKTIPIAKQISNKND